ncbi:uncharacterized protein LOC116259661 [Nymphaea colorata]|nr:uncharacterized protein LOC116259661 [Nymphaea colorata]
MEEAEVMGPLPVAISAPPAADSIHMRLPPRWVSAEAVQSVAREAAERILAAERKAWRFQRDVDAVREEALMMLVRLKQTMDLKIAEAEKASFIQSRRIKELESQLMEAEDTIQNLRNELNRSSGECGKKNVIREASDPHVLATNATSFQSACNGDKFKSSVSVCSQSEPLPLSEYKGMDFRLSNDSQQEMFGNSTVQSSASLENFNACNPDLAAIILRCKETESYRNGCTQRIRAFEKNLLAERWPRSEKNINGYSLGKNGIDATGALEQSFALSSAMNKENEAGIEDVNNLTQARDMVHIEGHTEKKEAGDDCYVEEGKDLEEHTNLSADVDSLSSGHDCIPLSSALNMADKAIQCEDSSVNALAENGNIHSNTEKQEMNYGPALSKPDSEAANDLDDSTTIETIMKSNSLQNSYVNERHSEPPNAPARPVNDKLLKYTFHRKRKREVSCNKPENIVEEKKPCSRKRTARRPRSMHKPCGSSTVMESSRDSRRLVQVARQLISLSGRRW